MKSLLDNSKMEELNKEIEILIKFDHPNLIKFWSMAMKDNVQYIIMEYANSGDLRNLLVKVADVGTPFDFQQKVKFIYQIALGMNEIHKLGIMHRDLACRNVLVNKDENEELIIKISDFGLSREQVESEYYSMKSGSDVPIRWTAVEVFTHHKYYLESDVWSFGVVIYEVFDDGIVPYHLKSNEQVMEMVCNGEILPKPINGSDEVYEIMKKCMKMKRIERPSFETLIPDIQNLNVQVVSPNEPRRANTVGQKQYVYSGIDKS